MRITDKHLHPGAAFAQQRLVAPLVTAVSLTGAVMFSFLPGYRFQVTRILSFCRVKAGVVTAVVKVGTRTAASVTFTTATEAAQTLSTTLANLRGTAAEAITIELTSDASGVLTNGHIVLEIRPLVARL